MKFTVRIKRKHIAGLLAEVPSRTPQDVFELALEIGLRALTAPARGKAAKA